MTRDLLTLTFAGAEGNSPRDGFAVDELAEQAALDEPTVRRVVEAVRALDYDAHPWRDPETLRRLYYDEELSQAEIGERLGCGQKAVNRWMAHHDLNPGFGGHNGMARKLRGMNAAEVGGDVKQ